MGLDRDPGGRGGRPQVVEKALQVADGRCKDGQGMPCRYKCQTILQYKGQGCSASVVCSGEACLAPTLETENLPSIALIGNLAQSEKSVGVGSPSPPSAGLLR
jgi:hypothetical protein